MEDILTTLESTVEKHYAERKFKEVEDMFATFLKEACNEPAAIRARALNNRGHAKYMQVEFESAVKDYDAALELDYKLTVAKYNRGTIYYRMGKFDQALSDLEAALKEDPSNKEFQESLDKCRAEKK